MDFCKYFDHTILKADASKEEIDKLCEEAVHYQFASVCVNGSRTRQAAERLAGTGVNVCTVIGFPLGASGAAAKKMETIAVIEDGAQEIDMVINVGALKDGDDAVVKKEIQEVKQACGQLTLKVIIETCLLTDEEKIRACELAVEAGADFVKTSTGFSTGGATVEDVRLMRETVDRKAQGQKRVQVKASGGIRDYETAKAMIEAGADRLGTSATVSIVEKRG